MSTRLYSSKGNMDHKKCCAPACGVDATLICSGCRSVRYCCKDHQKAHWGEHKQSCKPYKEVGEIQTGKHLVASRNLEPGDIILREAPLLLWLLMTDANQPKTVCVGCCEYLDESTGMKQCLNCKWPKCKEENCWAEASPHALGECTLIKAARPRSRVTVNATQPTFNSEERGDDELYYSIMVFRCLELRDRDMVKWKKLMELKDFQSTIDKEGLFSLDVDAIVELVKLMLANSNKPVEEEQLISKLCRVFHANKFSLQPIPNYRPAGDLKAVYHVGSMIEHNCVANCTHTFTKDGQIVVRAAVPIKIGAKISLNYTTEPFWNTLTRRLVLSKGRFFDCLCERCKDPAELGTFASGIYCPKCPDWQGIFLPENPLDARCDWICIKCLDRSIFREGFAFESQCNAIMAYNCLKRSVANYEGFIRKFTGILHPHHTHMTTVKMELCSMYGQSREDKMLDKKVSLAREMLKIADVLTPGLSHERASLLNYIYSALMVKISNLQESRDSDSIYSAIEIARLDTERKEILDELLLILSFEPEESDYGQLFKYISTF